MPSDRYACNLVGAMVAQRVVAVSEASPAPAVISAFRGGVERPAQ